MGKPYERPVAPDEAKQGAAEAIAAARAQEPPSSLLDAPHTQPQPLGPAVRPTSKFGQHGAGYGPHARSASSPMTLPPGERERYHVEQAASAPEQPNGKRPDAALASALAPQMALGFDVEVVQIAPPGLSDKFIAPPFSVLDTRAGYWQDRRRAWLSIGFRGETHGEPKALNTTAGEHEAWGQGAAAVHAGLRDSVPSTEKETYDERVLSSTGRADGLIYQASAPGSDPQFYERKRAVEAELGRTLTTAEFQADHYDRDEALADAVGTTKTGTSVFDPVLCEIVYRWFSAEGGQVLDPFAGGVVRGAVAAILGRRYWGCELRPEQIADNRRQADALFGPGGMDFGRQPAMPYWQEGDSTKLAEYGPPEADLVFSCPPYGDLERYSDDPRDLSTMTYDSFLAGLFEAMKASADALKPDRFFVWVVGEFRGKDGCEAGFVADTLNLARNCGLKPYNTAILLNSVGSAALRAQMILRSRKLTRVHQTVLCFVKGDPKRAAAACGTAEVQM